MKITRIAILIILGIVLTTLSPLVVTRVEAAPATIYVPDDYSTIQAAVVGASPGDTIIVRDGTYTEMVHMTQHLTIHSENGADTTIVHAVSPANNVFEITADYVNISGFTVIGPTEGDGRGGIKLDGADYCNIADNIASNGRIGIYLTGSSNNTITNNNAVNNSIHGIHVRESSNDNIVIGNTLSFSESCGIDVYDSNNNIITNNNVFNNSRGIHFRHLDGGNIIINNNVFNNSRGIHFRHLDGGNIIINNNVFNNSRGIDLDDSSNNIITNNVISNNKYGMRLTSSNSNVIYRNDFIGNIDWNVLTADSTNTWNSPEEINYSYDGSNYTNYLGNCWDDYAGSDTDGDGIGETPYSIDGDNDTYPLIESFNNYQIDEVVNFPDPNLEAVIREWIGKPTGDIYQSDLVGRTQLDASNRNISDLTGLEHCVDLWRLYLQDNNITNIAALSTLTDMGILHLSFNQITDVSPLASMSMLQELWLRYNHIENITPLAGLNNLTILSLRGNQVTDISPLASLNNLQSLSLEENAITELSPITGLTNLTWIGLRQNLISDISPIAGLTNLQGLNLENNQISNLLPLAGLTNLQELYLWSNQIIDISPLAGLTSLTWLNLRHNQINDISPLVGLINLRGLVLESNHQISDISALAGLTELQYLRLASNDISDISPLEELTNLYHLCLEANEIGDIKPLVDNTGISQGDDLDLRYNPLSLTSNCDYIPQLQARGVQVFYDTPSPPCPEAPPEGCFIATAAYGTSTASEIDTLRAFRDEVLLQNSLGSQLVTLYYDVSPPVADFISEHDVLRTLVRELLVEPVAGLVEATESLWGN